MSHIDALSRNAVVEQPPDLRENFIFCIDVHDQVATGQMSDIKLAELSKILQHQPVQDYERQFHQDFKLRDNKLFRKLGDKEVWVVPRGMRRGSTDVP